ncbi:MAG: N-acetylglucosamine kinase, partial [Euzebyales bacterium]|nr:N-acetylglucosamine kinase [Euzebyales bacterium]
GHLAPAVAAAAEQGDAVAAAIVEQGCDRLLSALSAVANACPPGPVVLAGGVLDAKGLIGRRVMTGVLRRWPAANVTRAAGGEVGAARLAAAAVLD